MSISDKQRELDEAKWLKSEVLGFDACGTFDYCANCDKANENPCDVAYTAFNKTIKTACKSTAKKSTTTKKATTKKATTKKTTTKKTTSKTTKK